MQADTSEYNLSDFTAKTVLLNNKVYVVTEYKM